MRRIKELAQNQNQTTSANKKMSNYITIITAIVALLAIIAIAIGLSSFSQRSNGYVTGGILLFIGLAAFAMSAVTLYQARRQASELKIEIPKVMTTIGCNTKGCDSKTVREFQRGDYVYKELDTPCQKCSGRQMITAIYKEVKEKEKTYGV
jgi:hypothetical protein